MSEGGSPIYPFDKGLLGLGLANLWRVGRRGTRGKEEEEEWYNVGKGGRPKRLGLLLSACLFICLPVCLSHSHVETTGKDVTMYCLPVEGQITHTHTFDFQTVGPFTPRPASHLPCAKQGPSCYQQGQSAGYNHHIRLAGTGKVRSSATGATG